MLFRLCNGLRVSAYLCTFFINQFLILCILYSINIYGGHFGHVVMAIWWFYMTNLAIWYQLAVLAIWRRFVYLNYPPDNAPAVPFGNPARVAKRYQRVVDKTVRLLVANVGEPLADIFNGRFPRIRFGH